MPILRQDDARVGCLALPISAIAGFVLFALGAASLGFDATTSTIVGLVGLVVGAALAAAVVRRS